MRKFLAMIAAVAALTFTACNGSSQQAGDGTQSEIANFEDLKALLTEKLAAGDATAVEEVLQKVQVYVQDLISGEKMEEAKKYVEQLKQFISENKATIQNVTGNSATVNGFLEKVEAMPTDALDAFTSAATGLQDAAAGAVEDAQDAVEGAVEDAQQAVEGAVEDAQKAAEDAANQAVDDAKAKVAEGIDNAADATKKKLGL